MVGNILAVGLMSLGMGMSGVKDEPQMYVKNESTYTITYENAEDWEERADQIYSWLAENEYTQLSPLTITGSLSRTYNGNPLADLSLTEIYYQENRIDFNGITYYKDTKTWDSQGHTNVMTSLTITSQTYYEGCADFEPPTMGDSIIGSIASGLGLIGALATEFLAGFGALFYSAGSLTPFAIFSLVMLGVAVSFAIVKLVLNLIRSNTGA